MIKYKAQCVSINPYLLENMDGNFVIGDYSGEMSSLTLNKEYEVTLEEDYYCVVDDSGEDYLYPKSMFKLIRRVSLLTNSKN